MSANLNIVLFSIDFIDIDQIIEALNVLGLSVMIQKVETIKNWEFENLREHALKLSAKSLKDLVDSGDIILISGLIIATYYFGIMIDKLENGIFDTRISIDTKLMENLDNGIINSFNQSFYDSISKIVLSEKISKNLLLATMGVESVIEYDNVFRNIFENSHNIVRWIISNEDMVSVLKENDYIESDRLVWDKKS
ncbi:hypothetical protein [Paenibacillus sp. HW567]|uniref:hypothetical protein n=1 Tax=Paenibacillus sp. HW567 TaxID=1034769 RepID=UPI000380F05F|nr:hypothetical protein [Paenibacillus sp. HW567]